MASERERAHQKAWRERQRKAGLVPVLLWVPAEAAPDFKTAADIAQKCGGKAVRLSVCDDTGRFVSYRKPQPARIGADEINPFVWVRA